MSSTGHAAATARTLIRPSEAGDLAAICAIYGWHVAHGTGTFELEAPDLAEMSQRHADVCARGLPWLVAERRTGDQPNQAEIVGYAYANLFRPRMAYRFALEDSIYLRPDACAQGIGRLLLAELMARCQAWGGRQMLAVIGDSQNTASIAVHRSLGFTDAGVLRSAGWKFGRWLDVVLLQRALGPGDDTAPVDRP